MSAIYCYNNLQSQEKHCNFVSISFFLQEKSVQVSLTVDTFHWMQIIQSPLKAIAGKRNDETCEFKLRQLKKVNKKVLIFGKNVHHMTVT